MDKRLANERRAEGIRRAFKALYGSRNRAIVRMYLTGKYSLEEVGQRFGLSRQGVYWIVKQARSEQQEQA